MRIRSFGFDPDARREFVGLPWSLRAEDPTWIPPIRDTVGAQLGEGNPFFRHGRARHFLAVDGKEPVGRCSAIVDDRLSEDGRSIGALGYFEVRREYATAAALLDEALAWLSEQQISVVWAPIDFSIFNAYRFKVGGFDLEPFFGEPNNPPAYPEYFSRYGFEVLETFCSWDLDEADVLHLQRTAADAARRKELTDRGYTYRPLDTGRFEEDLRVLHGLAVECFSGHTAFVPVSPEEFAFWLGGPRALVDPALTLIFLGPTGDVAGASYSYPDWAPLLRSLDGDWGPGMFEAHRPEVTVDRAVYHTQMVNREHRGNGLVQGSYAGFIPVARSRGYTRAVTGLANPERVDWSGVLGDLRPTREYALYHIEI